MMYFDKIKQGKNTIILVITIIAIIGFVTGLSGAMSVFDNIDKNIVYEPVFDNMKCVVGEPITKTYKPTTTTMISCGTGNINVFNVYTKECSATMKIFDGKISNVNIDNCPSEEDGGDCVLSVKAEGDYGATPTFNLPTIPFGNRYFIYDINVLGFSADVDEGDIVIETKANTWHIDSFTKNNYRASYPSCFLELANDITWTDKMINDALEDGSIKLYDGKMVLGFDKTINVISGFNPYVNSANIIMWNGKEVWTMGNQEYYDIETSVEGIRFVSQNKHFDKLLICNPAMPNCEGGTKVISPTEKTCDPETGVGSLDGWVVVSDSEVCDYDGCSIDGEQIINDCKKIPLCKDTQVINDNYDCVSTTPLITPKRDKENDNTLLWILGFSTIALLMITYFKVIRKKKK